MILLQFIYDDLELDFKHSIMLINNFRNKYMFILHNNHLHE